MVKQERLLQSLSDLFNTSEQNSLETLSYPAFSPLENVSPIAWKAQGQWFGAIAALESLLLSLSCDQNSLVLSGPTGIIGHPQLTNNLKTGIFNPEALKNLLLSPFQLPACDQDTSSTDSYGEITELPLFPQDPIAEEQFCLVFTPYFGLLMVLGEDKQGNPKFHFSFDPELLQQGWTLLRSRLQLTHHPQLSHLDELVDKINTPEPKYQFVLEFSRQLLEHLPEIPFSQAIKPRVVNSIEKTETQQRQPEQNSSSDAELLQALTHEIRTPLTTIRTMTQLLLKRGKLTSQMQKCLEVIDQECTEQINRMELIFQAAELETKSVTTKAIQLVPISLEQVFKESIPRWQKQAKRRNINLEIEIPAQLPQIISDPSRLDRILGGLMEKVTRNIPNGGEVNIQVSTAGDQLKLQVSSPSNYFNNPLKALGQLLMFQPDTGCLSLNLDVTKNLFQALGGKLIVRQKSSQDSEIFTVFLPLGQPHSTVEV